MDYFCRGMAQDGADDSTAAFRARPNSRPAVPTASTFSICESARKINSLLNFRSETQNISDIYRIGAA
jgi:hypothetical protein